MKPESLLDSLQSTLIDATPDELFGALLIALAMALITSGLYFVRRRKVSEDTPMLMNGLVIGACVLSLVLGAAYGRHAERRQEVGPQNTFSGGRPMVPAVRPGAPETFLAHRILKAADRDQDGNLSSDEAARAAERFVRTADTDGDGTLEPMALVEAIRQSFFAPPPFFGPRRRSSPRIQPGSRP